MRSLMLDFPVVENSAIMAEHKGELVTAMASEQRKARPPLLRRRKMACGVITAISLATLERSVGSYIADPIKTKIENWDKNEVIRRKEDKYMLLEQVRKANLKMYASTKRT
ncbi:hypothetical protein SESBI_17824 [Sesbania bispinosa]|nr:hypothetical protein SESBI_17824 [Sesbania bispinosa]